MSSSNSPCAACKFLRRKCVQECLFAPYFPADEPEKFSNVHKVYGASNVGKILNELPAEQRYDAVNSLAYEAEMRLQDPVYGCVGTISVLQQQLNQVHSALFFAKRELANFMGPNALLPLNSDFANQSGPSALVFDLHRNYNMGPFSPPAGPSSNAAGPSSNAAGPSQDFGSFFPSPSHAASLMCLDGPSHDVGPSRGRGCGSKLVIREPHQQQQQQFSNGCRSHHAASPSHGPGGGTQLVIREPHQQQQFLDGRSHVFDLCLASTPHGGDCKSKLVIREPQQQQQQQPQFMRFHGSSSYEDSIVVDESGGGLNEVRPTSAAALTSLALEATPLDLTEYDHHRFQAHHHQQQQHQDDKKSLGQFSLLQQPQQQQLIIGHGQSSQEIPYHEHNNHQQKQQE